MFSYLLETCFMINPALYIYCADIFLSTVGSYSVRCELC